jgi:hypothetical protein
MKNALTQLVSLIETQIINIRKSIHRYVLKDYQSPARCNQQRKIEALENIRESNENLFIIFGSRYI